MVASLQKISVPPPLPYATIATLLPSEGRDTKGRTHLLHACSRAVPVGWGIGEPPPRILVLARAGAGQIHTVDASETGR